MSVNYSSSISYGFIIPEDNDIKYDKDSYTLIEHLQELFQDLNLISADLCGDLWSGKGVADIVYIRSSYQKLNDLTPGPRYTRDLNEFSSGDQWGREYWQLAKAWMKLGFDSEDFNPGWILEFTVS